MVGRHEAPHLGVDPLAGGPVGQVGVAAGQPLRLRVDLEPELVRDPGEAQQPERVVGEDPVRDERAVGPPARSPRPPNGSTHVAAPSTGIAIAFTVKSRSAQVVGYAPRAAR